MGNCSFSWRASAMTAQVVHELKRIRNGPITMLSYLLPAAVALRDYHFASLRVVVDGIELAAGVPGVAYVGNVREYGAGFPVLPFARADDGLLDICLLPCRTRRELFDVFLHAIVGRHVKMPGVLYVTGKSIQIETDVPAPVQLDGDAEGYTPLDINLLPVKVPFIVTSAAS